MSAQIVEISNTKADGQFDGRAIFKNKLKHIKSACV